MALTLNKVIQRIKTLSLSHDQINDFRFGDNWEFTANGDLNYPFCGVEQTQGTINRTERLQTFNFHITLADRVLVAENTDGNEQEVISDMSSVAADLLAMLMYYENDGDVFMVSENNPVQSFTEGLEDMVAGVVMDIGISVEFISDRCQAPATDVTFEEDFDMARTRLLPYDATGSEGGSFTVTNLAGKIVIAVFRGTTYKRPITTTPPDSDKIKITGTDLGDRKGILSSDGSVGLSAGDFLVENETLDFLIWE